MDKQSARKAAKARLLALTDEQKRAYCNKIMSLLRVRLCDESIKTAFIYMSADNEPDTKALIAGFMNNGVGVFVPITDGDEISLVEIDKGTTFTKGRFGIFEADGCKGIKKFDADVNIIPLVAFDKTRNRCGHGKGYYDKYLAKASGLTVALAFSAQEVESVECADHDIKPDIIITEKGIIEG